MTYRLFAVFLVALFILVLGGTGALTNGSSDSVPRAEAIGIVDLEIIIIDPGTCDETVDMAFDSIDWNHFAQIGLKREHELLVQCYELVPNPMPKRLISGGPFTLGLSGSGNFVDVSGIINPTTGVYTGLGVGTVAGFPDVTVVMELHIDKDGNITGTYTMGAGGELPGGQPGEYAVTGVWPLTTPTPTPSATPTTAPTATATTAPGQQVTWADNNCKDGVNPVDSLLVLRADAGLTANTGDCPPMGGNIDVLLASLHIWGDVDCKNGMTPVDSLKILRFDAGLSVSQEPGCPAMGSAVTLLP